MTSLQRRLPSGVGFIRVEHHESAPQRIKGHPHLTKLFHSDVDLVQQASLFGAVSGDCPRDYPMGVVDGEYRLVSRLIRDRERLARAGLVDAFEIDRSVLYEVRPAEKSTNK